jgi:hypothetical protein
VIARFLVLALPLLLAGEDPPRDPFLAALAGRSGPEAVAAPGFDAEAEAFSWSLRPRREVVDGLAARLLRGEARGWAEPSPSVVLLLPPPPRIPPDFDPSGVPVSDPLAAWVPADAAAVFFPSLREAEDLVAGMAFHLAKCLPALFGDPPGGRREALRRAAERILLPTIWAANPGVRTGTRRVALVAADPDLRWGADVALVAEVDDASLVTFHRRASLRWEGRAGRTLRVEGLDAVSDDGSIRSFFGMEGGVAVWSTTRDLRDRILAAGSGRGDSLLRPDRRAFALARRTFPASEGGALLVVPEGLLARANDPLVRARRAAALRCEAARLLLDASSLAGANVSHIDTITPACPAGGVLRPVAGAAGSSCSIHGTASDPVPLGDLPEARPSAADGAAAARGRPLDGVFDGVHAGALPVAARFPGRGGSADGKRLEILVPPASPGTRLLGILAADPGGILRGGKDPPDPRREAGPLRGDPARILSALTGIGPPSADAEGLRGFADSMEEETWVAPEPPPARPRGGVLLAELSSSRWKEGGTGWGCTEWRLRLLWR